MPENKLQKRASYKKDIPAGSSIYIGDIEPTPTQLSITYLDVQNNPIKLETTLPELTQCSDLWAKKTAWLAVCGLKDTSIIREIGQMFAIHPLVIEDLLNTEHLSKVQFFSDYIFIISKIPVCTTYPGTEAVQTEQVSFIIKDGLLITFQEKNDTINADILHKIKDFSIGQLVYGLIDTIIDNHYLIVETKGNALDIFEEKLIKNQLNINLGELYAIKRDLLRLRKNALMLQNIVAQLIPEQSHFLAGLGKIYLHDLQDHLLIIGESIDIHYELCANVLQVYLSSMSNKTNETMKILTLFAAIFIPLSFVASIYGMNFVYMPGLKWEWGYWVALGGMGTLGIGLLMFFRKKGWI